MIMHHHGRHHQKALKIVIFITSLFMVLEFAGGWIAQSLALMTDAVHMLADVGALIFGYFVIWLSSRPGSLRRSFGFARAEVLGALISGIFVWVLVGGLLFQAFERWDSPREIDGGLMVLLAAIGLVVNLVGMRVLHRHAGDSLNLRAAYLHVLGDALGSVGALVAGVLVYWKGWVLADSLVTLLIAALIFVGGWRLIRDSMAVLMEFTPKGLDPESIYADLREIEGVTGVHDLHVWAVSSQKYALSAHLISRETQTLSLAQAVLEEKYGIRHTTIQIENPDQFDSERCYDCAAHPEPAKA